MQGRARIEVTELFRPLLPGNYLVGRGGDQKWMSKWVTRFDGVK